MRPLTAERRAKARRMEWVKSFALIGGIALVFLALPLIFKGIDCNTAERNLRFMDRCIAADNCNLTAAELNRFEGFTRMQLKSCKED